jgi:hypothetical protein
LGEGGGGDVDVVKDGRDIAMLGCFKASRTMGGGVDVLRVLCGLRRANCVKVQITREILGQGRHNGKRAKGSF